MFRALWHIRGKCINNSTKGVPKGTQNRRKTIKKRRKSRLRASRAVLGRLEASSLVSSLSLGASCLFPGRLREARWLVPASLPLGRD